MIRRGLVFAFGLAMTLGPAFGAPEEPEPPTAAWLRTLEVGVGFGSYSDPYGSSDFQFARLSFANPDRQTWRIEASRSARFGDEGYGFSASLAQFFRNGVNVSLGASTGTGDLIYPDHQIDASLGKAFREKRNLVASIFYSHAQSKQENSYDRFGLGLVWYKDDHWIVSASARTDFGDPGDTTSTSGAFGVTYGIYRERYIGVNVELGSVSYLLVGPTTALVDYDRTALTASYQEYLTRSFGITVRLDAEHNDAYDARSGLLSIFKEW